VEEMADDKTAPVPEGYKYLREELRFENTLLVGRLTAYITSQSFLFTASAVARGTNWRGFYWISGGLLPLVGVAASVIMLEVVRTAYGRMDEWRAKEKAFAGHPLVVLYPEGAHKRSLLFTTLMPCLFLAVWVAFVVLIHVFQPQAGGGM
jgi:hypothetical protein